MRLRVDRSVADPLYVYYFVSSPQSRARILADAMTAGVPKINLTYLRKFQIVLPSIEDQRRIANVLSAYDDLIENNNRRIQLVEFIAEQHYREWFVRMRFPGHQQIQMTSGIPSQWTAKPFSEFCVLKRGYDLPNAKVCLLYTSPSPRDS